MARPVSTCICLSLLICHIAKCDGMLESVKESLNGLMNYTAEVLPYLHKGVKMVQQAEQFVDSAIGEDCTYECDKEGYEALPRSGYIKTSNGCGSFDFIFDDSPDSLIHVEKEFIACCNDHDECYDTCNLDKDDCDLKFKRCLYGYCKGKFGKKKKPLQYLDRQKCKLKAKLFYITVVGVGCQAYRVAQKNACRCVKILERPRDSSKSKHEKDEL